MADLQSLGVVSIDSLVPRPIEPIPNSNQLPFDWECPVDPPGIMPRIQNLFDMECMCQDGKPDAEFWQWAAVAAAKDLGVFVLFGEWRAALTHLKARRTTEWSLLQYADADLAICTEVNLFLSRTLKESEMVAKATATKKAAKPPTREIDDDRPLPKPMSQADRDEVLRRLCCVTPSIAIHWRGLAGKLSADEIDTSDVLEYLREIWAIGHSVTVPQCGYASAKMGTPLVWFDQTDSKGSPSLSGDALAEEVCRVMGLDGGEQPAAAKQEEPVELSISDEITQFPVAKMTRSPYQTRQDPPAAWLRELADTMERDTQLMPCLVRPNGEIIAGHTRHAAAKLLGWSTLQVRIVTCDDTTARRLVLLENAKRRDLTEREKCEAYGALAADYAARGIPQKQLAADLGLKEGTLSNNLRLKSLPPEVWERNEKGCLSTDQIRKLATLADHGAFAEKFIQILDGGHVEAGRMTGADDFDSAYDAALDRAFRPMEITQYGQGCKFTPTAEQRKELQILKVEDSFGNESEVAANVELWEKLNKAALKEARAKEKAAHKTDTKSAKAAERVKAERRDQERRRELNECWYRARALAITQMFDKPRKQDQGTAIQVAVVILDDDSWGLDLDRKDILQPHAEFVSCICARVREYFADTKGISLSPDIMEELIEWLHLNPVPYWKPSEELLKYCTAEELAEIAEQFDLPENQKANDLIDVLLKEWPLGHVPDLFLLDKPKAKKATKKGGN